MTTDDKATLNRLLALYLAEADFDNKNFMHRDSTMRLLRDKLTKERHWKQRVRGKPQAKAALLARLRRQ